MSRLYGLRVFVTLNEHLFLLLNAFPDALTITLAEVTAPWPICAVATVVLVRLTKT